MVRHARDDGRVFIVTTWVPAGAAMVVQSLRSLSGPVHVGVGLGKE